MGTERADSRPLDFIVIGAAKSGTTTLFHHLRPHPRIFMPGNKEAPFFTRDEVFSRGWEHYREEYFAEAPEESVWGKITPRYLGDLHVPQRMHDLMPDARLIALLRNPVDRAFSKYRLLLRLGNEDRTFAEVVDSQLEPAALEAARTESQPIRHSVVVRGEYGRLLQTFLDWFPSEQLLVRFTEELEEEPQSVLDDVLAFVGLDPGFTPDNLGERFFVGGEGQRFPKLVPLAERIPPVRALWRLLPKDRRRFMHLWFTNEVNVDDKAVAEFPPEVRARLVELYRPDVRRLEAMLGRSAPWPELAGDADEVTGQPAKGR